MGRRKELLYIPNLVDRYQRALGLLDYSALDQLEEEIEELLPEIDWLSINSRVQIDVPEQAIHGIDQAFRFGFRVHLRSKMASDLAKIPEETQISSSDFLEKAKKIEKLARHLTDKLTSWAIWAQIY